MKNLLVVLGAAAAFVSGAPVPVSGQLVAIAAQEDNGQLAEWLPERRWTDDEYANGVSATATWQGPSQHASRDWMMDFTLGQQMYTPPSWHMTATPVPGERPYVGWLYVGGAARALSATRSDGISLDLGITGPPALAGQLQSFWHHEFGAQHPLGWSHQVPFSFAGMISATETRDLARLSMGGVRVLSLEPTVQLNVGNWLTSATAKMEGRLGYGVAPPWAADLPQRPRPLALYVVSDVQADYVWQEFALDRPTSDPSLSVSKIPWVGQYAFGAGFRIHRLTLEYRGTTRAQEYTTGPRVHAYGAFSAMFRL